MIFHTSALTTSKIDIQASSSVKLSSTNETVVNCLDVGILEFFGLFEIEWFIEILSDSFNLSSCNPS